MGDELSNVRMKLCAEPLRIFNSSGCFRQEDVDSDHKRRASRLDALLAENARLRGVLQREPAPAPPPIVRGRDSGGEGDALMKVQAALELKHKEEQRASSTQKLLRKTQAELKEREVEIGRLEAFLLEDELELERLHLLAEAYAKESGEKTKQMKVLQRSLDRTRGVRDELRESLKQRGLELQEETERRAAVEQELEALEADAVNHKAHEALQIAFQNLAGEVGLRLGEKLLPARILEGERDSAWEKRVVRHISFVIQDRPADLIARAFQAAGLREFEGSGARSGKTSELMATPPFRAYTKQAVAEAIEMLQDHWSARLSVHLQSRLDLSRVGMDKLRHLLSYVYDPEPDLYKPIKVWQNPDDESSFVLAPSLVGRSLREKLYKEIASRCEISVDPVTGRCERDTIKCTNDMYRKYHKAMRDNFSTERPAQPMLYIDATGCGLGRGVTHVSIGTADFIREAKQSRNTLQPIAGYAGADDGDDIRANLPEVMPSFNKIIRKGRIFPGPPFSSAGIPARPAVSADMQAIKALFGMMKSCHSVWCLCQGDEQHQHPDFEAETWDDVLDFYDHVGCVLKTAKDCCEFAHYSYGIWRGEAFTPIKCRLCGYCEDDEESWLATVTEEQQMDETERKEKRKIHNEQIDAEGKKVTVPKAKKHHHQIYLQPPVVELDMERAGCDLLHLLYLNLFKHLFSGTCHNPLPDRKKKMVRRYIVACGFYSYNAADETEDPVQRWIGREVKRFIEEAHTHLPFLLRMAAAPPDLIEEVCNTVNRDGVCCSPSHLPPNPYPTRYRTPSRRWRRHGPRL